MSRRGHGTTWCARYTQRTTDARVPWRRAVCVYSNQVNIIPDSQQEKTDICCVLLVSQSFYHAIYFNVACCTERITTN